MIVIDPTDSQYDVYSGHVSGDTIFEEDAEEITVSKVVNSKGEPYLFYNPKPKLGFLLKSSNSTTMEWDDYG